MRIEECIIGVVLSVSGISLCFLGASAIIILFSILTTISYAIVITAMFLQIFRAHLVDTQGLVITIVSVIISAVLSFKTLHLAESMAEPIFSAMILFSFSDILCQILKLRIFPGVNDLILLISFFSGLYLGNKFHK